MVPSPPIPCLLVHPPPPPQSTLGRRAAAMARLGADLGLEPPAATAADDLTNVPASIMAEEGPGDGPEDTEALERATAVVGASAHQALLLAAYAAEDWTLFRTVRGCYVLKRAL